MVFPLKDVFGDDPVPEEDAVEDALLKLALERAVPRDPELRLRGPGPMAPEDPDLQLRDPLDALGSDIPEWESNTGHTDAAVGGEAITNPNYQQADVIRPPERGRPVGPEGLASREYALPPGPRPDTAGRRAHRSLNALFSGLTGHRDVLGYDDRVAREKAQDAAAFQRDQVATQRANAQRPIGERLAAQLNLDPNMTFEELEAWRQGSGGKLANTLLQGRLKSAFGREEGAREAYQKGQDRDVKREGIEAGLESSRIAADARVRAARKRDGLGGGGPAGPMAQMDFDTQESIEFGDTPTTPEERTRYNQALAGMHKNQIRDLENRAQRHRFEYQKSQEKFYKLRSDVAPAKVQIRAFNDMVAGLSDQQLNDAVKEMRSGVPKEGSLGYELQQAIKRAIGPIIRTNSGANLTGLEKELYAGPLAPFLDETIFADQANANLAAQALELGRKKYLKTRLTTKALLDQMRAMQNGVQAHHLESVGGAHAPALMWREGGMGGKRRAAESVKARFLSENPSYAGWKIGPGSRLKDGSTTLWLLELMNPETGEAEEVRFRVRR